ncbi:PPE family protein [Mycobacterium shimoidei]|uniref:PPE family protein PPE31, partial [Mycobacterium tuberculosis H37Rv] n=1 Tax=Mycobacterium shimoidei TaxID=29313 RepID=A0A1E3T8V1_MYCSH
MDFGALPPEINSARMYAGPGSAPMLAAASAWDGLAAELRSAAASYQSVIAGLTGEGWMGPAAQAMAAAAAPYILWMSTTAEQAAQTAAQAKAAAAAYEAAFAMTVPPPVIAANRAQLAALVATNVLGQNTPAIAATEAQYGEMWAQDAAAMYGYAGNSAVAAQLTPFSAPQQNTNPAGLAAQGAATAQAAGSGIQSQLSQLVSTMPTTLQGLAAPLQTGTPGAVGPSIPAIFGIEPGDLANASTNLLSSSFSPMGLAGITQVASDLAVVRGAALVPDDPFALGALDLSDLVPGAASSGLTPLAGTNLGGAAVSAGLGRASSVGALSVPQTWTTAAPAANATVTSFPGASWASALPEAEAAGVPGMPGMAVPGSGGRGVGLSAPRYGFKPTVMARPVAAG